jgi:Tol biopolymer transport system component
MSLLVGTRLGCYEVHELIGQGGMGEVYRARDLKLNRDVALKTLPAAVALDPDRLLRFKREAQVLAALNHSNIAAIYGLEESDGAQALVLELVDGPTLADRIAEGPLPLDEALAIARQIADALEGAHARGIVHRDLKPANIKLRADGSVKVLDFGLAKAIAADPARSDAFASPTITSPALTRLGMILGTAAYMSPEQARGREADTRSDIWAFGCVLFEMLTGQRPFDGTEVSDTLASILKTEPQWPALPPDTPSTVRRVLRRCLQKDHRKRIRDIADVRLEIEDAQVEEGVVPAVPSPAGIRGRERIAWGIACLSLLLGLLLLGYAVLTPTSEKEVTRFQVYAAPDTILGGALGGPQAFNRAGGVKVAPDGTRLLFVATDRAGKTMLWVRAFDSFEAVPLTGSDGASLPFWAPNSRAVGFFSDGKLKRIDAAGGSAQVLCDIVGNIPRGGTWARTGEIVFGSGNPTILYRVPAQGGTPVPLPMQAGGQGSVEALWPIFLPDGRTLLYWARRAPEGPGVYAFSLASSTSKKVVASDSNAAYDPSGFLLFVRGGGLLRQPFDPARLEVSGAPTPVAERLAWSAAVGVAAFSVSDTGVLAFQPDIPGLSQFAWFDRRGHLLEAISEPAMQAYPSLSPDGKRLVYRKPDGLWMLDMTRRIASRFTTERRLTFSPIWSPDGNTIFFRSALETGEPAFFAKNATGTGEEKLVLSGSINGPMQVSRDGKWLLYFGTPEGESVQDIYVLPLTGKGKPQRIVQSPYPDVEPQFSPDGTLIAWASSETGPLEVYVQPFPGIGERKRVSSEGGRQPLWRSDGKELFFVNDDKKLFSVEVLPGPTYSAPRFLFEMRANVFNVRNSYIPSPDGQRFLVNMLVDTAVPPIHVVKNWAAEVNEKH